MSNDSISNNRNHTLSNSAKIVQNALLEKGLTLEVVELPTSARTANEAAESLGCNVSQIVKSLLFRTKATSKPILVLASGSNRVNEKNIEKLLGESIIKAEADYVHEITGFAIGGIPPLGHKQKIDHIFVDEDLLKYDTLWAAAGTQSAVFRLQSKVLSSIIKGEVISIK